MITLEEVRKIAKLSKLSMSDEELEALAKDMVNIVSFADTINEAQVENADFDNINGLANAFREDDVRPSYDRGEILKNVDGGENGFFHLPKHKL